MRTEFTIYDDPALHLIDCPASSKIVPSATHEKTGSKWSGLVIGLAALIMFAVLTFGGTDRWAIATFEVGSGLLFLCWAWPRLTLGQMRLSGNPLYLPMIAFGLIIVAQVVLRLSAYVHATRFELWQCIAFAFLFLVASHFDVTGAYSLYKILSGFGFAVAMFGLIQHFTYEDKIYWYWPGLPTSFGPYVDHNHYAGLMEMIAPIPLAMALTEGAKRHERLFWMIASVLMAATIFVCGSRGGMIAFGAEMVLLAALLAIRRNRQTVWVVVATSLVIGLFALWLDSGMVLDRVSTLREPLSNDGVTSRLLIAKDLPSMLFRRPITGWGLGVFPIVYPQYRTFRTNLLVNEAHNDYLQALVETGILGFTCAVWFIVNLYRAGLRNLRDHSQAANLRTLGPLVGCTGILIHSFSEFNMHIPANAALFFVLSGIASRRDRNPSQMSK